MEEYKIEGYREVYLDEDAFLRVCGETAAMYIEMLNKDNEISSSDEAGMKMFLANFCVMLADRFTSMAMEGSPSVKNYA